MPRELSVSYNGTGATLYVVARLESDGTAWSVADTALVTYIGADLADYAIALTDDGGDLYVGDMPASLPAGDYRFYYYEQASPPPGGSPAATDLILKSPVRHWDGAVLGSGSDVSLSAYALTDLTSIKRRLGITDSESDTLLTELINEVSLEIERVTGVKFAARDYRDWLNGANQREILLPHYPVQHVTRITWGVANAFAVTYSGSAIRASASVYKSPESADAGGMRLVTVSAAGAKTTTDLSFATYPSVQALATAVAAISGWTLTQYSNQPTADLHPSGGEDALNRPVFVTYPDQDCDAYSVDYERGIVQFDIYGTGYPFFAMGGDQRGSAYLGAGLRAMPRAFQHVLVEYSAGYTTIPADVQGVANYLVADAFYDAQIGKGVTELKLGPGTIKLDKGADRDIARDLAHYIDASRMIGGAR